MLKHLYSTTGISQAFIFRNFPIPYCVRYIGIIFLYNKEIAYKIERTYM